MVIQLLYTVRRPSLSAWFVTPTVKYNVGDTVFDEKVEHVGTSFCTRGKLRLAYSTVRLCQESSLANFLVLD